MDSIIDNRKRKVDLCAVQVACNFAVAFISGFALYQGDSTLSNDTVRQVLRTCLYLFCIISIAISLLKRSNIIFSQLLPPIIYVFICYIDTYIDSSFQYLLLLELSSLMMLDRDVLKRVFDLYCKYLIISSYVGIIIYLIHIIGIPLYHRSVPYYFGEYQVYIDYGVCWLYQVGNKLRLCGNFNEPGLFGTLLALYLCVEKLNLKKFSNIIVLFAGFLTFSLAFIVIVVLYFLLLNIHRPYLLVLTISASIIYLLVLPNISFNNPNIDYMIQRMTIFDGKMLGDNRSNVLVDSLLNDILESNNYIWFGRGSGYASRMNYLSGVLTYKTMIIDYGIIGFALIYISLFVTALRKSRNIYSLMYLICFYLSIYQRPAVYTAYFFVMLFGGIYSINSSDLEKVKNEQD